MDWWLLTFFIGAILSLFLPEVPAIFQLFLLFFLAIGFLSHKKLRISSGLWFGALWILLHAHLYNSQLPPVVYDLIQKKQQIDVEGKVLSLVVTKKKVEQTSSQYAKNSFSKLTHTTASLNTDTTTRFNFLVSKVNSKTLDTPFKVRLSWKNTPVLKEQDNTFSLKVKLKPSHGLANIGTFNYLSWLKANNIAATGYVVKDKKNKSKHQVNALSHNQLTQGDISFRQQLFNQYQQLTLSNLDNSQDLQKLTPILLALTFGERGSLDKTHWEVLQATGTSHLIAISGLHVGLLAGFTFFIVTIVFRYIPLKHSCWQRVNTKYIAILVSLLSAGIYTYLAGFSLPTERALVMLNLYWISRIIGIRLSTKRLLLISLFIITIISPFSLFTASFWLSFYAVSIIFITIWRFKFWLRKGTVVQTYLKGLFVIQLALTLMLLPITAVFFHEISIVALFANMIAVPWMSLVCIPTALLSLLLMPISEVLAQAFMFISLKSLFWLWSYLELLTNEVNAVLHVSWSQQVGLIILSIIAFALCYIHPVRLLKPSKLFVSYLIILVLIVMLSVNDIFIRLSENFQALSVDSKRGNSKAIQSSQQANGNMQSAQGFSTWKTVFLYVGQGLSVLIIRNNKAVLYDTGAAYPGGFNMSDAVILPYLQYSGIKKIDHVILSHSDNDHAGGISQLLAGIAIDRIISNDRRVFSVLNQSVVVEPQTTIATVQTDKKGNGTTFKTCTTDSGFYWQGLTFDVLWPIATSVDMNKVKQGNDDSCVILITDQQGHSVLLAGDISSSVELALMARHPQLEIDVLQVPHHGSKTSSSDLFLSQLSPTKAIVSAGFYNRWNMPVASVEARYNKLGIELLNNAEVGQVIISLGEEGIETKSYTEDLRPFWFSH